MPEQLQFPFPSLDFPGRAHLRVEEVAQKLGVTPKHVGELIEQGKLVALDNRSVGASRACYRIPIESWRNYVVNSLTAPAEKMRLLRDLPAATRRQLIRELQDSLKAS